MSQGHTSKFETTVDGQVLPAHLDAAVLQLTVENSVKLPDSFSIAFRDPHREVLEAAKVTIGSKVEIRVFSETAPQGEKLVAGEVTAVEAELDSEATVTVVRGLDLSHRLSRGRVTESYANVTYSDVATKVARRAGLETGAVDPTKTVHDHVSQGNVTDWDFLNGLAREVGFHVGVIDGKFEFRKPKDSSAAPSAGSYTSLDPLQLVMGKDLLRFRAVVRSSEQVSEVQVRGWDMKQKKAVVGTAPAKTTSAVIGTTPTDLAGKFASRPYVGVDVPYDKQSEVDAAAAALAEDVASSFAEFEGVARGNPQIRAGRAVSLSLVKAPFDGKYSVTSSRHTYEPGDRLHRLVHRQREPGPLDLRAHEQWVGRRLGPRRGVPADPGRGHRHRHRRQRPDGPGPGEAEVPVAVGDLRERLGPYRAAVRRQRAGRGDAPRGQRRGARRLRPG